MKRENPMARTVCRCNLTDTERKVARAMFCADGVRQMTLAECAREVGTTQGWCYRAFNTLCEKIAHRYWQKPDKRKAKHEE